MGIGCEVCLRSFEDSRCLEFLHNPFIFASNKTIFPTKKRIWDFEIQYNGIPEASKAYRRVRSIVGKCLERKHLFNKNFWGANRPEEWNSTRHTIASIAAVEALKKDENRRFGKRHRI